MDFVTQLGMLALASRFKRLTNRLYRSGEQFYASLGVDFELRRFLVMARLKAADGMALSVTSIAHDLGVTHPAVVKVSRELQKKGLVTLLQDRNNARKRCLRLTTKGSRLVARLEPVWAAFDGAARELCVEIDCALINLIDRIETALDRKDMASRISTCCGERETKGENE